MQMHNIRKPNTRHRRGTVIILAIISLLVISIIAIAIMDSGMAVFQQARRQPRLMSMQALADAGAQYGYWKYKYCGVSLPYTETGHALGPGSFSITITNNNSNISSTIQVVSTATIKSDSYSITRIYDTGGGSASLSAPVNLVATGANASIGLSWNSVTGASTYNIYRGTSSNGESAIPYVTGVTTNNYTDSTVSTATTYYYFVTAVSGSSESSHSNEASAGITGTGYVTVTPSVSSLSNWYGDLKLSVVNTQPMTSLTVTINIVKTTGLTYNAEWNNFWGGYLSQSYVTNTGNVTYSTTLNNGLFQTSGSYAIDSAFNLTGTAHATSGDTYTVVVTANGITQTLSGHF